MAKLSIRIFTVSDIFKMYKNGHGLPYFPWFGRPRITTIPVDGINRRKAVVTRIKMPLQNAVVYGAKILLKDVGLLCQDAYVT